MTETSPIPLAGQAIATALRAKPAEASSDEADLLEAAKASISEEDEAAILANIDNDSVFHEVAEERTRDWILSGFGIPADAYAGGPKAQAEGERA